jgi:hypothetical protein
MRDQQGQAAATGKATDLSTKGKKPYTKPSFREERAFETMALHCGKVDPTQGICSTSPKNS